MNAFISFQNCYPEIANCPSYPYLVKSYTPKPVAVA